MKVSPNIVLRRGNGNAPAPKRGATGRNKGGRPPTYTEAKAAEICRRMVEGGITTHYLQIIWNADFRDGIQLAADAF